MNWIKSTYRAIADHVGKILSGIGATLLSIDVAGYGDQLRTYAGQYLGENSVKKLGVAIFVLLFIRTFYTGCKASQAKQALDTAQAALPPIQFTPAEPQAPIKPAGGG
jgi:hypothetical protein